MDEKMAARLVVVETISSVCWFLMDASWMFGLPMIAKVMAILTIATSLLILKFTERHVAPMLVTAAMTSWAVMNVFWMLNDLTVWNGGLAVAQVFFAIGTLCLLGAMVTARRSSEPVLAIIARFRRLRIFAGRNAGK
jgi:hypothetical protein